MHLKSLLLLLLLACGPALGGDLHEYVIERNIPGAHRMSADELRAISRKSRDVLQTLGDAIAWKRSYVAEDKFYCVYTARDKDLIRKHAELGGFPVDRISQVSAVIDPSSAE
ncbi:MAG: DUF4242 domain-containing protein [Steroidobacter sp.]